MGPLVERHYVPIGKPTTKNLPGVITEIQLEKYNYAARMIHTLGEAAERNLGGVTDSTAYYNFKGTNTFLENGLAQVGKATTTDNNKGFNMMRLFANSIESMQKLEKECGF